MQTPEYCSRVVSALSLRRWLSVELELLGINWHRGALYHLWGCELWPWKLQNVFWQVPCQISASLERSSALQRCAESLLDVGVNTEPNLGSHWPKTQVPPAVAGAYLSLCELAKVHLHCGILWVCEEQLLQSLSAPPPSALTVGFCPVQVLMVLVWLRATQGFIFAVVKLSEPWAGWAAPGLGQGHHVVSLRLFSHGGQPSLPKQEDVLWLGCAIEKMSH